jgi:DNA uptake protein ComE-like DNA-binding protein
MTPKHLSLILASAAMCIFATQALAYEHLADQPAQPASKASPPVNKMPTKQSLSKSKPGPKVKLVDVNTANKAALKKLPGITDADADKIIANRPYGSKAWLVTKKVVDDKTYAGVRTLIEARQALKAPPKKATTSDKAAKK